MSARKIIFLVFGIFILLVAVALLIGGGALTWIYHGATDSEGFIGSGPIIIEKGSHAIVTGPVDIEEEAITFLNWLGLDTVRVKGSSNDPSKHIFIGIAGAHNVYNYLREVEYDELNQITRWLSFRKVEYTNHPGNSEPATPLVHSFWTAFVHGPGTQILEWDPVAGSHAIVLMNDDGSAGIDINVVLMARIPTIVLALGVAFLVGGMIALFMGIATVYFAVRRA